MPLEFGSWRSRKLVSASFGPHALTDASPLEAIDVLTIL
jgi:hypothetical protein